MSKEDLLTKENFGDYADIEHTKVPLTEEQITSTKYAKFYDYPIKNPTEEQLRALLPNGDIDISDSLTPMEYPKLFDPAEKLCENGFCVRPEGYGFSAMDIKFPGVTWDMFMWFSRWYTQNPVQYMIWLPRFHVVSSTDIADEDLGWGVMKFDKMAGPPCTLETFGIENPTEKDPDFIAIIGGNQHVYKADCSDKDRPIKMCMINYFRRCGDGIENRVRVWMGIHYINGEIVYEDAATTEPLHERARWMACHNAWEWTRAASMLPDLYKYAVEIGDAPQLKN